MFTQLARKTVKTRKAHRCFACAREFEAGTTMEYQTNIFDDQIYSLYTCETCELLMSEFPEWFEDDGLFPHDCVAEQLYYDDELEASPTPEQLLDLLRNGHHPDEWGTAVLEKGS